MNKKVFHSGEIVKKALADKNMTQSELARKIGKDQTLISRFITGQPISDTTARAIAEALDLDFEELRVHLQRDRFELQREKFGTKFKEVIDVKEPLSSETEAQVAHVAEVSTLEIPLLDSIPDLDNRQWRESDQNYIVPQNVKLDADNSFAIKVSGESMVDDVISEGDIVIIDTKAEIRNGDRVLVKIIGKSSLKKIHLGQGENIVLQSPADSKEPFIFLSPKDDFKIIGKVVSCIKHFA